MCFTANWCHKTFMHFWCDCEVSKFILCMQIISPGDLININKLQVFFIPRCSESNKYKRKNRQTKTKTHWSIGGIIFCMDIVRAYIYIKGFRCLQPKHWCIKIGSAHSGTCKDKTLPEHKYTWNHCSRKFTEIFEHDVYVHSGMHKIKKRM